MASGGKRELDGRLNILTKIKLKEQFRLVCKDNGTTISKRINTLMEIEIKKNNLEVRE